MNDRIIRAPKSSSHAIGIALLAALFATIAPACDPEDGSGPDDDIRSLSYCHLGTESGCEDEPQLAEAIAVVRAMDIDPDQECVELWVGEGDEIDDVRADYEEMLTSDEPIEPDPCAAQDGAVGESLVDPLEPVAQIKQSLCKGSPGACTCCCYWTESTPEGCACWGCW